MGNAQTLWTSLVCKARSTRTASSLSANTLDSQVFWVLSHVCEAGRFDDEAYFMPSPTTLRLDAVISGRQTPINCRVRLAPRERAVYEGYSPPPPACPPPLTMVYFDKRGRAVNGQIYILALLCVLASSIMRRNRRPRIINLEIPPQPPVPPPPDPPFLARCRV